MQEAKSSLSFLIQFRPISSRLLQQAECAVHIGVHEIIWAVDGAVHVTLRRKVDKGARMASPQEITDKFSVGNIAVHEAVARISRSLLQIAEIPGIGKLVKIHDPTTLGREPLQDEIGTDKTSSAGHQNRLVGH